MPHDSQHRTIFAADPEPGTEAPFDDDAWTGANGRAAAVVLLIAKYLADRPKVDTVVVVDALLERFQDEDDEGMVAQCIASMRAFRDETGGSGADGYAAWQKALKRPHPHPPLSRVRGVLGGPTASWNVCKSVAYHDPVADPTVSRMRRERDSTEHECEEAGRRWLADRKHRGATEPLNERDFVTFCRSLAARDDRPIERLPLSEGPLKRHFGGWFAFLARIGALVDDDVFASLDSSRDGLSADDHAAMVDTVLAARAYAAQHDGPMLRSEFFTFYREQSTDGSQRSGSPDWALSKYFGTFRGLLATAGLEGRQHDPDGPVRPPTWDAGNQRTDREWTDEQLLDFVDRAAKSNHGDLSQAQLRAFAHAVQDKARRAGKRVKTPRHALIIERFGGVAYALAALGYITFEEADLRSTRTYPPERLEEALIGAMLDYTPTCTPVQYRLFAERARADGRRFPATQKPIIEGLDVEDFDAGKKLVMERHPDIEWPTQPKRGLRRPYHRRRRRS